MKEQFLFGAATSSVQIEGGYMQDGKGWSIWDEYCKKGLIKNNQTCYVACDSYNRLEEDLANIKDLGLNAYRFSISWPRIQPDGSGKVNQKGIDYYNRLIDGLLKIGVTPFVTLFHWDLPIKLDEQGGFSNRAIVDRFAEYGKIVAENFGDRVEYFSVFNEIAAIIDFLYEEPVGKGYPPKSHQEGFEAIHNILLSNAAATYALRKYSKNKVKVGMVSCSDIAIPVDGDLNLAREVMLAPGGCYFTGNTTYWDPMMFGKYNEAYLEKYKFDTSFIKDGDMEFIKCVPDFIGMNIYLGTKYKRDENGKPVPAPLGDNYNGADSYLETAECMYYGPKIMQERYGLPIYVTETGIDTIDCVNQNGEVIDDVRSEYLRRYFPQLLRAKNDGVNIRGYFMWSLMDNFEWSTGYTRRFGLIRVNFDTLERLKKKSFYDYAELIKKYKNI